MAIERFGRIKFPGVGSYDSCSYVASQGISPGILTMIVPERGLTAEFSGEGDLEILDGVESFVVRGCRLDKQTLTAGTQGRSYRLTLMDRRWRWPFVCVSGCYNERDERGEIKPATRKGLRNLVNELMELLGQKFPHRLGNLPNLNDTDLPTIKWNVTNAAQALQSLVEPYGHRVVFDPIKDELFIAEIGEGALLPEGGTIDRTPSADFLETAPPAFLGGLTNVSMSLVLEPVGEEMDGSIVPLHELSYRPKFIGHAVGVESTEGYPLTPAEALNPWLYISPSVLPTQSTVAMGVRLPDTEEERQRRPGVDKRRKRVEDYRQLALSCVWRLWRPKLIDPFSGKELVVDLPEVYLSQLRIEDHSQIRLLSGIYSNEKDSKGQYRTYRPRVYGRWTKGNAYTDLGDGASFAEDGFQIDSSRNLVRFDSPRFLARSISELHQIIVNPTAGVSHYPIIRYPYMVLQCSVNLRAENNHAWVRHLSKSKNERDDFGLSDRFPYTFTNVEPIVREEVVLNVVQDFDVDDGFRVVRVTSNKDECGRAARTYFDGADKRRQRARVGDADVSGTATYPGVRAVSLDGAIGQVTWSVGGGGPCTTTVSRNTQHSPFVPSFEVTKRNADLKELVFVSLAAAKSDEQQK